MNKNEEEYLQHPAFGMIGFSRVSCSDNQSFFGSELPQSHFIEMTLQTARVKRDLTSDRFYSDDILAKVRMTSNQFSEMVFGLNIGDGVPCTIVRLPNGSVDELPEVENRKSFVHRQFKNRMKQFAETLKSKQLRVKQLTAKKTLSKADQDELNRHVEWLTQEVANNIPLFAECFQETTDKVVLEAKSEIENAILHKVNILGLDALHRENNLLK